MNFVKYGALNVAQMDHGMIKLIFLIQTILTLGDYIESKAEVKNNEWLLNAVGADLSTIYSMCCFGQSIAWRKNCLFVIIIRKGDFIDPKSEMDNCLPALIQYTFSMKNAVKSGWGNIPELCESKGAQL